MKVVSVLPVVAAMLFMSFGVTRVYVSSLRKAWMVPAGLACGFFAFSLFTASTDGPTGFWIEHTRNLWGNQIWFDLLLATSIGWLLIVPHAIAVGMRPIVWLPLVAATGSIGFLAMLARLLYLRERAEGNPR